mgnify:CR=1 FL=1|tara:strand:+ start:553 stop:840 length:288 start_codon:yes stop_codon:yes gene_type:complete
MHGYNKQMREFEIELLDNVARQKEIYNAKVVKKMNAEIAEITKNYNMGLIFPNELAGQIATVSMHAANILKPSKETVDQVTLKKIIRDEKEAQNY